MDRASKYYITEWHRIIMPLLRYNQPNVANLEDFPFSTLKLDKKETVFFHVAYVKPGRSTYVIQHAKDKTMGAMKNKMLFNIHSAGSVELDD